MSVFSILYSQFFVTPLGPEADFEGQTIIVTGANVGLGLEAAKHFARLNASTVILACRDERKGEAAADLIRKLPRAEKCAVEVWPLDLSSSKSVLSFADRVQGLRRLDTVIQNAGILTKEWKEMEGNESTMKINVYSPTMLGLLVLPKLRQSAKIHGKDGRLVFVGSELYALASFKEKDTPGNVLDNLDKKEMANMADRYNVSKLVLLFASRSLAAASPVSSASPVIITTITPGFCKSDLFRDEGISSKVMNVLGTLIGRTTEVGSRTLVDAASSVHGREVHGQFLWDCRVSKVNGFAASSDGMALQGKTWNELRTRMERVRPGISSSTQVRDVGVLSFFS